jgi:hypothetical protein
MVVEGAALLAAAIRAAIHAKAPRRTVQAVAAAVTGVLWRPTAAAVPHVDASGPDGTTVEDIRAKRIAQRQRKKLRRRSAAAQAACAAPATSAEVLQCQAVRAKALVVETDVVGGIAHGVQGSKRRKKGGDAGKLSGGVADGNGVAGSDVEVLQRKAVRASTSMDIADSEVLDDYWADEGMPQAAAASATVCTDVTGTVKGSANIGVAMRRKYLLGRRAMGADFQAKIEAAAASSMGSSSHWAVENLERIAEIESLIGLTDLKLAGIDWPPSGI